MRAALLGLALAMAGSAAASAQSAPAYPPQGTAVFADVDPSTMTRAVALGLLNINAVLLSYDPAARRLTARDVAAAARTFACTVSPAAGGSQVRCEAKYLDQPLPRPATYTALFAQIRAALDRLRPPPPAVAPTS